MTLVANHPQQLSGNKIKTFFWLFVFVMSNAVFAQDKPDLEVHKINGNDYYIHVVDSGNTLYAISRKYAIPIEILKKENPRLTQNLTIGDRLLIPLKEVIRKDLDENLEIDGNFLIHEVKRKNTLYSIAKEYNVEINDIIIANPEVENGLKNGMKIRIPVEKVKGKADEAEYIVPASSNPYVTHLVMPKETLYSLSKQYEVTVDSILQVNNGLPEGLKIGQLINIPILKTYEDTSNQVEFDSTAIKNKYQIALLLPFYIDENEVKEDTTESYQVRENRIKALFAKAQYGVDFYQGFKLALDSLVDHSFSIDLMVFDTANDTLKVDSILSCGQLDSVDLIVGPLYYSEFVRAADFAKTHGINIVSPVKQSNRILLGNSYVSKVASSEPIRLKFIGKLMANEHRYDNLMIVYPDHVEERNRVELIKKHFQQRISELQDTLPISFPREFKWDPSNFYDFKSKLVKGRVNTIITPTHDQAFATRFLTMLFPLKKDYEFKIVGLDSWSDFESIELEYLDSLNVHVVTSEYYDYSSAHFKQFEKHYHQNYSSLPDKFSLLGFDVGYYYGDLLKEFGVNFEVMFLGVQNQGLGRKFEFFKTGIESGYENHSVYMLGFKNYRWAKIY